MCTSRAPCSAASSSPRSSARYSATLLLASPILAPKVVDDVSVGLGNDDADCRRSRVAARAAVDVQHQLGVCSIHRPLRGTVRTLKQDEGAAVVGAGVADPLVLGKLVQLVSLAVQPRVPRGSERSTS